MAAPFSLSMGRLVALAAALLASLASPHARAEDDWEEARKTFRRDVKAPEAAARRTAFQRIGYQDRAESVEEIVGKLASEPNLSVCWVAIKALARQESDGSRQALAAALRARSGVVRLYLLVAYGEQRTDHGADALLEVLREGKDPMATAHAAIALGKKGVKSAVPDILPLLAKDDWHLRSAAGKALAALSGLDAKEVLTPLADALAKGEGRERADLVAALEKVSGQKFGYDPDAWKQLAGGTAASSITAKPRPLPHFAGIPLYGRRLVVLVDNGVRTDDQLPFSKDRMQEVSQVPGARPVPWYEIQTIRQFVHAHASRAIKDLDGRGAAFDLFSVGEKPRPLFGKLTPVNDGTRKRAVEFLAKLKPETAHDDLTSLYLALDVSGNKDGVAWSLGPEEIVYSGCTTPWLSEVTDQEEVALSVGLKARLRLVPVHNVGLGDHPYAMMTSMSELSGGTYVNLAK
jgi:HEAT repeat protein